MPNIYFRGCQLQEFKCKPKDGGRTVNATFQADYSESLRKSMSDHRWAELPDGSTEMGLKGSIIGCVNFILTPNGLKTEEIDVKCVTAKDFEVIRINKKGKKDITEDVVRFKITMGDLEAVAKLDRYMNIVGVQDAQLKLIYSAQETIPGGKDDSQRSLIEIDSPKKAKDVQ